MEYVDRSETQYRLTVAVASLCVGMLVIGMLSALLPLIDGIFATPATGGGAGSTAPTLSLAGTLLDKTPDSKLYPLTLHNLMWLVFFLGCGELWVRWQAGMKEEAALNARTLPEEDAAMLRAKDLVPIFSRLKDDEAIKRRYLGRLVRRIVLQFQTSGSVDQSNALLNSSLELMQHEMDLRYSMLRYIMWLIPTLGFVGTVVGIAIALNQGAVMPEISDSAAVQVWVKDLTLKLGFAFSTTLVALLMAAVLVFAMHIVQAREETVLNHVGQYCLDNLINRLYEENR